MKRTLFLLPCALVLGVTLWALNWKLDNPPLTQADQSFARFIQGADEVEITTFSVDKFALLKGKDLRDLLQNIHLSDELGQIAQGNSTYTLDFRKRGKSMVQFDVDFDAGTLYKSSSAAFHPSIESRSRRNFERALVEALIHAPPAPTPQEPHRAARLSKPRAAAKRAGSTASSTAARTTPLRTQRA